MEWSKKISKPHLDTIALPVDTWTDRKSPMIAVVLCQCFTVRVKFRIILVEDHVDHSILKRWVMILLSSTYTREGFATRVCDQMNT